MAKGDDIQRTSETTNDKRVQNSAHVKGPNARTSPTFQQLLQRDGSKWSHIASQINKKNHGQEDDGNRHNKKSVLAKVKEKAKKFKMSLRSKKHTNNESRCPATRLSGVGPKDKGEEDPEYHTALNYESTSGNHLKKLNVKQSKDEHANFSNTKDTHFKIQAPSDPSVVTAAVDADIKNQTTAAPTTDVSSVMVATPESSKNKSERSDDKGENTKGESQTRDKGVSVKEYLMHKFEPGEDERALSKVITQTISPRRDKVRYAMSALLKNEESSETNSSNVGDHVNLNLKSSKSLPASTNNDSKITPIKQSNSLGSNASKASLNLNQTFKSTFASYQDHFLSSSSNHNSLLNSSSSTNTKPGSNQPLNHLNSPKTSSSPLGHASNVNETQAPGSSAKKTRVPGHVATSVRRVPVSRANKTQGPSRGETNRMHVPISPASRIDANATRAPISGGDQGRFRV